MPGEDENLVADLQPTEADNAAAEAAFDSGFDDTAPTTTPEPAAAEPTADAPPAAPAPEPTYAKITEAQFTELLAKAALVDDSQSKLKTAFGSLGALKQTVERLQSQTQSGQSVEVTADDVADIEAEFPELAGAALKSFQKLASKFKGTGSANPEIVEKMVSERVAKLQAQMLEDRLDDVVGGNWREEVRSPAWKPWFDAQAEEVRMLGDSDVPSDAAKLMRLWVKTKSAPAAAPAPKPAAPAPAPAPSARQRQIAASVNPKGSSGSATGAVERDPFDEGFYGSSRR